MADPLSIASGIAGLVAIADTIFSRTYRYARLVKNAEKDVEELATGIRSLSGLLHGLALVLHELEVEASEQNFRLHHINSCRTTLTKIQKKLDSHDYRNMAKAETTLQKLKWPFSVTETKELVAEVERHKATINVALSADSLATILKALSRQNEVAHDIRELKREMESRWAAETHITLGKNRQIVLDFFGKIDPTSNHKASLKLRHPLTGLWVTEGEIFRTWLQTRNSKLWLSGIPGAGKTILAASLIDETMDASSAARAVAYFYCDYKDLDKQNPINILGSLATQLARQEERAFEILHALFLACHPEDRAVVQPELQDLVSTLIKILDCFEDVSIIVDGLDECGDSTSTVVESLAGLASANESNTSVLLLSRDIQEIRRLLEQNYTHLEIAAHSEDLKIYVAAEIETRQKKFGRGQLRIRNPDLKEHIMKALVDRAEGMFRWVACQLDYLCDLPTDAEKRLALTTLPPNLNKTYERILEGVNRSGPAVRRMVKLTLHWIIHSAEKLSTDALCEAISIKERDKTVDREAIYDEEDILMHCSSLVRRSAIGTRIELAHFTVQEFLVSIERTSPFSLFAQRKDDVYPTLAKICLTYVSLDDFEQVLVEDFAAWEEQQRQYPFREHAVHYWQTYAKSHWEDGDIITLIHQLFSPSKKTYFLSWARDYVFGNSAAIYSSSGERDETSELFGLATALICTGGVTPLHLAAFLGSSGLCQWLISSGCFINQNSSIGTPLHCALTGSSNFDAVVFEGIDQLDTDPYLIWEADDQDAWNDRRNVCELLIANGADPSAFYKNHLGKVISCCRLTLLISLFLCDQHNEHPIVFLIKAGARLDERFLVEFERRFDIRIWDYYDKGLEEEFLKTFIEIIKQSDQDDSIKEGLLEVAIRSRNSSAVHLDEAEDKVFPTKERDEIFDQLLQAVRFDQIEAIQQIFKERSLDLLSLTDDKGRTPLHIAIDYRSSKATKILLELGADPNKATLDGLTPLHCAMKENSRCEDYIRDLLDYSASTTAVHAETGCTCWHMAVKYDNKTALELLLSKDPQKLKSLATQENEGLVPLFYAAKYQCEEATEILLSQITECSDELRQTPGGLGLVHRVVEMNSIKLLRLLQSKGFALTQQSDDGRTALHFLPFNVRPELVRLLIAGGVDVASTLKNGTTSLHRFVTLVDGPAAVDDETFNVLAPPDVLCQTDEHGHNALHYALGVKDKNGCLGAPYDCRKQYVKLLLDKGFDLSSKDSAGKSYIQIAFEAITKGPKSRADDKNFPDIIAKLVEGTDDLDILNNSFGWFDNSKYRLISWALAFQNENLVKLLLAKGVDMNLCSPGGTELHFPKGSTGLPAIYFASLRETSPEAFHQILKESRNLNDRDGRGYSLAHLVSASESTASKSNLETLFEAGIDFGLHSACRAGWTPLMVAARAGRLAHVKYLVEQGIDFKAKDYFGCTVMHHATLIRNIPVLDFLTKLDVDWGIPVKVTCGKNNFSNWNILPMAATNPHEESVRLLQFILKRSLVRDLECLDGSGFSALHLATTMGLAANVEQLLLAGANIESKTLEGQRPIHSAVIAGRIDAVRVLLRYGCTLVADARGLTPELYALRHDKREIIELFKEHAIEKGETISALQKVGQVANRDIVAHPYRTRALSMGIKKGDLELCKSIIMAGTSINQTIDGCEGCTPVLGALSLGQKDIASYFIEEGASTLGCLCNAMSFRSFSCKGSSAVHIACCKKSMTSFLPLLLAKDLEAGSPSFRCPVSPIHIAVANDNIAAVKLLLEHFQAKGSPLQAEIPRTIIKAIPNGVPEKSPSQTRSGGVNWLPLAENTPDTQIDTKNLDWEWVLYYPPPDAKGPKSSVVTTRAINSGAGLHIAAYFNNTSIGELLIEYGASPDLQDTWEQTPLHIAARMGSLDFVNLLLKNGANTAMVDYEGRIPAMIAADCGHLEVFEALEMRNPSIPQCDNLGWGLFHHAGCKSPQAWSYLSIKGYNPYILCKVGRSSIDIALNTSNNRPAFWTLICNSGLDFERCEQLLPMLEFYKVSVKSLNILLKCLPKSWLIKAVNATCGNGRNAKLSPLGLVARWGRVELLELLLRARANIEFEREGTGTPLVIACSFGRLPAVKYLARAGAKVFTTRAGRPFSAVQAARDFPPVIRWFLVEQYTDQRKITDNFDSSLSGKQILCWSGPRRAEVELNRLYGPVHGASSLAHIVEISSLKRSLRGKIVSFCALMD